MFAWSPLALPSVTQILFFHRTVRFLADFFRSVLLCFFPIFLFFLFVPSPSQTTMNCRQIRVFCSSPKIARPHNRETHTSDDITHWIRLQMFEKWLLSLYFDCRIHSKQGGKDFVFFQFKMEYSFKKKHCTFVVQILKPSKYGLSETDSGQYKPIHF